MTVAVLLDINMSPEWVSFLSGAGHTTTHWVAVGDPKASDSSIMAWAMEHDCIVLTRDLDFGTALALTHAKGPSVVQIRAKNLLPEQVGTIVPAVLGQYEAELAAGALVVVEEAKSRVRVLPF